MEYALEGYGYSPARVARAALQAAGVDPQRLRLMEHYLARMEEMTHRGGHWTQMVWHLSRMVPGALGPQRTARGPAARAAPDTAAPGAQSGGAVRLPPVLEEPPELLGALRLLSAVAPMDGFALPAACAAKAVFDRMGNKPRLTQCSLGLTGTDEGLAIAVYSRELTAEARAGDQVAAGVLVELRKEQPGSRRRFVVMPRIYRKVCQNGTVAFSHVAEEHEIDPRLLLVTEEASAPLVAALEAAVHACLDVKAFDVAVQRCRWSAAERIEPRAEAMSALAARLPPRAAMAVSQGFEAAGDFTHWGMVNALTAEARTAPAPLASALERVGGALLSIASPERVEPAMATRRIVENIDEVVKRARLDVTSLPDLPVVAQASDAQAAGALMEEKKRRLLAAVDPFAERRPGATSLRQRQKIRQA